MEPNLNYMTSLHLEWQTLTSRTLTAIKKKDRKYNPIIYSDNSYKVRFSGISMLEVYTIS